MTLTIITINYNNASGLQKTMESVLSQTSQDFEYIVIDGASTDGSVDYLKTINYKLQTTNYKLVLYSSRYFFSCFFQYGCNVIINDSFFDNIQHIFLMCQFKRT